MLNRQPLASEGMRLHSKADADAGLPPRSAFVQQFFRGKSEMAYPNLLICGAVKAGTTSVFRYLAAHPEVCASSKKELNIFHANGGHLDKNTLNHYQSFFQHCADPGLMRLEASPAYFIGGDRIATKIDELMPDAKLIFILREPLGRYVSHFTYWTAKTDKVPPGVGISEFLAVGLDVELGNEKRSNIHDWSPKATRMIRSGRYEKYLSSYLNIISKDRICVVFYEDLACDPTSFMRQICDFAGIDADFYATFAFTVENKTRFVRFRRLHNLSVNINDKLEPFFNRFPLLRKGLRAIYYRMNPATKERDNIVDGADLSMLADFYKYENIKLRELLVETYPDLALPSWLQPF